MGLNILELKERKAITQTLVSPLENQAQHSICVQR